MNGNAFFGVGDDLFFTTNAPEGNNIPATLIRALSDKMARRLVICRCFIHALISMLTSFYRPDNTAGVNLPGRQFIPFRLSGRPGSPCITSAYSHIQEITLHRDKTIKDVLKLFIRR
ncbi:hypothetical protein [Erwinia pyrifoliae]|uniref:Uncharacterized protein n=1 Tax=Erwinia pyrifoliae TaxID=79967 RepID=A0ABY5X7M8_ERWPY|nr:hypothetical protein [Erwinia pyrifoliae]MCT2388816.1 hypothetical protein [Erwinia pyrifoliae]UWS33306.1 hypothetical protein NYP84_17280 [Erwinia pyrifoliae]UWS33309.1 hypothetical protein NYP84_17295 [Erwinia pyrifoliae]